MAIRKIVSRSIGTDVIVAEDIANNAITVAELANGAVTNAKIAAGAISTDKLDSTAIRSGLKNRIINGAMVIDQRNAGASLSISNTTRYPVDRFPVSNVSDGVISVQQSSTAPTGFTNSLLVTVTAADASTGATQYSFIRHIIEGFNVADFGWGTANAKAVTLSFWVRSSVTGTFGGAIQNAGENRAYAFSYTINSANTFEQKTITIPGDTSGTWATNNTAGVIVNLSLGVGATYSSTANSWVAQTSFNASGANALLNTNGATFYLTGVQLEVGSSATGFEYRQYGQELSLCQRYYSIFPVGAGAAYPSAAGALANSIYQFPVAMRTAPTVTAGSVSAETNCASDTFNGGGLAITYFGGAYQISQGGAGGNYNRYRMYNYASAEL